MTHRPGPGHHFPPSTRSHFSCTKLRGGRGGGGPAARRYVLPGEGGKGGRGGGDAAFPGLVASDVRGPLLEQLSSAVWGGLAGGVC